MTDPLAALRLDPAGVSAAEARLLRRITADPTIVVDLSITDLAVLCETSAATIARFAQKLGFTGYRQFRFELAQALSRERGDRDRRGLDEDDVLAEDDVQSVIAKVAYQETRAIEQTAQAIDGAEIDAVAALVSSAARTDIFGIGASMLAAMDLHLKLVRIGAPAWCVPDVHLALVQAATRGPGDVVIGISHSGATHEVVELLRLARAGGATTVALTNVPDSPLTEHADHVLCTVARESRFRIGAMSSRTAQLVVIDMVFTRIVQSSGDSARDMLRRTREVIRGHNDAAL
ncbi:MurR/RpiR family transcriptional regulator [Microbacterium sp.]|uniref:MurR/RpiR family transcriptional regulator n=1 Tax=Microbacterium sp. TaxID=51671 RepID=UPI003A90A96A